jgi:hypothetical protein
MDDRDNDPIPEWGLPRAHPLPTNAHTHLHKAPGSQTILRSMLLWRYGGEGDEEASRAHVCGVVAGDRGTYPP